LASEAGGLACDAGDFRKNRASMFSADLAQTKSEQPVQAQAISNPADRNFTAL
jgi:hypothetical protein